MNVHKSLSEIVTLVNGTLHGNRSDFIINNIASLGTATAYDLAFVFEEQKDTPFDTVSPDVIARSRAGIIISRSALAPGKDYLLVEDPLEAYQKLVAELTSSQDNVEDIHKQAWIDTTAILGDGVRIGVYATVEAGAQIGAYTSIGAHTYIGKNCIIGNHVIIYPHVTILERTTIGNHSIIHSGAVIGSDGFGYHLGTRGLRKIPQIGTVSVGNNVEIGANVCIDRAVFDKTVICDGVKIDNLVHVAHNVYIGPHTAIIAQTGIAGSVTIGAGCQIGGQVGIKDHVTIGERAKIVSKSAVMKDVAAYEVVCGIPAIAFATWKRITVALMSLPELIKIGREFKNIADQSKKSWWRRFF